MGKILPALIFALLAASDVWISWDKVTLNEDGSPCTDLDHYTCYVESITTSTTNTPGPGSITKDFPVGSEVAAKITDMMPTPGTYRVWVDAVDTSDNHSDVSNFVDVVIPDLTIPSAPKNLRVK